MSKKDFTFEFEKEFFNVADNFRGNGKFEELSFYSLSLYLIKHLSENNEHPYKISNELNWNYIRQNANNLKIKIEEVFNFLENNNSNLKGLSELIFSTQIHSNSKDIEIYKLVNVLEHYELKNINSSKFAKFVINLIINKGKAGEAFFYTPDKMGELLIRLFNQKEGSSYDGTTGFGNFLIQQHKLNPDVKLFGQEVNRIAWAICKLNLILNGIYDAEIMLSNCLSEPLTENEYLKKFDTVVMEPPFGSRLVNSDSFQNDIHGRFKFVDKGTSGEIYFIQHALSSLTECGKAAIVVPQSFLFKSGADSKLRKGLLQNDLIETVITMPNNLYVGTGVGVVIIIINNNKEDKTKNSVQIINAENLHETSFRINLLREEDITQIVQAYSTKSEIENFSKNVTLEQIKEKDFILSPSHYFTKIEVEAGIFGNVVIDKSKYEDSDFPKLQLKQIATVNRGYSGTIKVGGKQKVKIINISDINNGVIDFDNLSTVDVEDLKKIEKYLVSKDDVLLSCRGTTNKVAVVPETTEPILFSSNLVSIKSNKEFIPEYIKAFLESPIGLYYFDILQKGTTIKVLNVSDIENIHIPTITINEQREINEIIKKANREYESHKSKIEKDRIKKFTEVYQAMGILNSFIDASVFATKDMGRIDKE